MLKLNVIALNKSNMKEFAQGQTPSSTRPNFVKLTRNWAIATTEKSVDLHMAGMNLSSYQSILN